jgi:putative addiction module component (TIGR02574 family)
MAETVEQLKAQLATLSVQERAELKRRVADIKNGKVIGKPADQVFAELREKYS